MQEKEVKIALILLAAGNSRRFQGNKLLHPCFGKPMYRHILEEADRLPEGFFHKKLIVTQYGEIAVFAKERGYEPVLNEESHLGISHSIHLGLKALKDGETHYCFAVCDQPYVKAKTLEGLIMGYLKSGRGLGCLCAGEKLGNPSIFSNRYQDELLNLTGDVGGKQVIRKNLQDLYCHSAADEMELADIDENFPAGF